MTPEEEQRLLDYLEQQTTQSGAASAAAQAALRGPRIGFAEAAALGGLDGLTFGWSDELAGLASPEVKRQLRERMALAQEQQGAAFFGGNVASSFIPGLGLFGLAGKVARLGGRAANLGREVTTASKLADKVRFGAGTAGVLGGVYGAGTGSDIMSSAKAPGDDPTIADRVVGGVLGAGSGAVLGGGFPALAAAMSRAAPVAQMPVRAAYQALGGKPDIQRAEAALMERLQTDFGDARGLEKAYWSNRALGGSQPSVIDLKPFTTGADGKRVRVPAENTSRLVEYAGAMPGEGRNLVRAELDRRIAGQTKNVENWIEKKTGGSDPFHATMSALQAAQEADAGPKYAMLKFVEVPQTPKLAALFQRPAIQAALRKGVELGANKGWDMRAMGALDHEGQLMPFSLFRGPSRGQPGKMNLAALDLVKQALDDAIFAARDPASGFGLNARGALKKTAAELVEALDEAVGQIGARSIYADARESFAGIAALKDAAELGRTVFQPGAHSDWLHEASQLTTESQREAARAGLRDALLEKAWGAKDGADLYRQLLGNKGARDRIASLFGPIGANGGYPAGARRFFAQVQQEAERLLNVRQVWSRTGSQTAPRQMEADEVDSALGEAMVNILMGDVKGAMLGTWKNIAKGMFGKSPLTPKEAEYVVREGLAPMSAARASKANNYQARPLELATRMRAFEARKGDPKPYRAIWGTALSKAMLASS